MAVEASCSRVEGVKDQAAAEGVLNSIYKDPVAADLKWSLFAAASQSYKHDSCLRPFPPMFLFDGHKDFTALWEAVDSVPALSELESSIDSLPQDVVRLLHWVLREPSLSVVPKAEIADVVGQVACVLSAPLPSIVVRLDHSLQAEERWAATSRQHGSLYAFHGSPLRNFHSILHHGLQQHLTKNSLYGQGVYLSSELLVCLQYSLTGDGWHLSCLGPQLSVVALCEILDHPSIHCQAKGRAMAEDSVAGEVPHTLYVVPNSDLVRVRYLLVYPTPITQPRRISHQRLCGPLTLLSRHKMVVGLVAYAAILLSVGLSRSSSLSRYWRLICHSIGIYD